MSIPTVRVDGILPARQSSNPPPSGVLESYEVKLGETSMYTLNPE